MPAEAASPFIAIEGLSKSFSGIRVLKDVSFDVFPGEVHALLGENGAGKSTLIKSIAGVHKPDGGRIAVDGKTVALTTPRDAQRLGIAVVYQELLLFPELTVAENIFLGHAPRRAWGGIDWPAVRVPRPRPPRRPRQPRSRRRCLGGHAVGRQPAAGRNRQGAVPRCEAPHHGRADRGPGRGGRPTPHGRRAQAPRPRRRHHLRQPPHERDLRAVGPRDGAARRRARRHAPDLGA